MALRAATRASQLALGQMRASSLVFTRGMSVEGMRSYQDREIAQENVYFRHEEERTLRKLLSKVKLAADKEKSEAEKLALKREELVPIKAILDKYKISESDIDVLLDWKHHHH